MLGTWDYADLATQEVYAQSTVGLAQYLFARLHNDRAFRNVHVARILNSSVGYAISSTIDIIAHYDVQNAFQGVHAARINYANCLTFRAQLASLPTRLRRFAEYGTLSMYSYYSECIARSHCSKIGTCVYVEASSLVWLCRFCG